jgi:hypothetical protein
MLSFVSMSEGISTSTTLPAPQSPTGSTQRARPLLVVRLEILIEGEIALALEQAEAAGFRSWNALSSSRIGLRSDRQIHSPLPACISRPSESWTRGKSPKSVSLFSACQNMLVSGAIPSRRGRDRGNNRRLHRRDGLLAGLDHEAVGARQARTVEQRVDHDLLGPGSRLDDPELLEVRELLGAIDGGVDRDPARGEPIAEILGDGAEVAGSDEDRSPRRNNPCG